MSNSNNIAKFKHQDYSVNIVSYIIIHNNNV